MAAPTPPPNLLLVLTDQQRFDALSAHGGVVRTPNLDALLAGGADLGRHYAQSPVCVPSRSTLFTGRYPRAHGVMENFVRLAGTEAHLLKVLQNAGYWLAYHGKNHLLPAFEMNANLQRFSDPEDDDRNDSARAGYISLEKESLDRLSTHGSFASAMFHDFPDEATTTGVIAGSTLASLEAAPADRPWCAVASFYDPHVPHLAPRRFADAYPAGAMPLPALPEGDPFAGKPARLRIKHRAQGADRATDADKRHYLSVYASMVAFVDEQVGRLLEAVRRRPDADRTVIVFTSDHGEFAWHHGLCKKDLVLYDDLLHVPAMIHWPQAIAPGTVLDTFTEHVDLLPTLLDLLGIASPAGCQGRSFAPQLRGGRGPDRDSVYAEVCFPWMRNPFPDYESFLAAWKGDDPAHAALRNGTNYNIPGDHTQSVRTVRWSYLRYGDGFEELYDLESDPDEWYNLAAEPAHAPTLDAMRALLQEREALSVDPRSEATVATHAAAYPDWISLPAAPSPVAGG